MAEVHSAANSVKTVCVPRMRKAVARIILAVFLLFPVMNLVMFSPSQAVETRNKKAKVVMVIVNRVTVEDITDKRYKNIGRLISMGGLGLMTINTGRDFTDINAYVTLGGGDRFIGSILSGEGYNRDETLADGSSAGEVYLRHTGKSPGAAEVLSTSIAATLKANGKRYTVSTPGLLGKVLHDAGLKTAVIGNSDTDPAGPVNRLAVNIAMDDLGRVDEGNVSRELLAKDPRAPFGWRSDYQKLGKELDRVWDTSDFIVIETGDTLRANENSNQLMKRMVEQHRFRALQDCDRFIGTLLPRIDDYTTVMMVTPLPHAQALRDGVRVTPLVAAGGGLGANGVLTSGSTRQMGLVANYDVTATVVSQLGAKMNEGILGLPVTSFSKGQPISHIKELSGWLTANSRQRTGVLYYFTRYQWIIYGLLFILLLSGYFRNKAVLRRLGLLRGLLAGILVYPLAILLVPLTGSANPWLTIFLSLLITALIAYLVTRVRDDLKMFFFIAVINVAPSIIDVLAGGHLMNKAALSYDIVAGGRFYGIGNEYMGVVIGAAILGASALLQLTPDHRKKVLSFIGLAFVGLIVFFAAPGAGSKAGGALTATAGFGVTMYRYLDSRLKLRSGLLLISALLLGVAVLAAVNYLFPAGEESHIGRAFQNLFQGNFVVIWQIAVRKLMANIYLLRHSPFSIILFLQALIWLALLLRNRTQVQAMLTRLPYLQAGMSGIFCGALAAITLNDSGVIGAPLLLNYLTVPFTWLVIRQPAN